MRRSLRHRVGAALAAAFVAALPVAARAAEPVTIVEDVGGEAPGVELMDYLAAGKVIRLGPHGSLSLGYLHSCVQETITGGTVTIGAEQSTVVGGQVDRRRVECDGGRMLLTTEQASQSGVMVFRRGPKAGNAGAAGGPVLTLYGASPLVTAHGAGTVVIERLDQPGEKLSLRLHVERGRHTATLDLAREGRSLAPGGLYRIATGSTSLTFRVSPTAKPGPQPAISRLIRL